jgi:RNA polymerase primary sigma factor
MSDLFDSPLDGVSRAGTAGEMSWDEFWSRLAGPVSRGGGGVSGAGDGEADDAAEWVASPGVWLSPRRPAGDEPEDGDEDDDDDDDDEDDDEDDLDDDDDLDDLDEDDELDDEDEDLDDDDLDDDEFEDDLVDLDDEYDTAEEEDRHRGGSDYDPD